MERAHESSHFADLQELRFCHPLDIMIISWTSKENNRLNAQNYGSFFVYFTDQFFLDKNAAGVV